MGKEIIWTDKAQSGLNQIFDFIANDSPIYAERFVLKLIDKAEQQLSLEPLQGRPVPELQDTPLDSIREIIIDG